MHTNPYEQYVTGDGHALTIVLVHGRTQTPAYMVALAERIGLPDIRYVLPSADGNTWYPGSFMAPLDENEPDLSAALVHYNQVIEGLITDGTSVRNIVVGGFSQGACLTAELLARFPRGYAGAILWTGGLIGPAGTQWPVQTGLSGMPVYLTTSDVDPWVPPERVRETADWLTRCSADAQMRIFKQREHEVIDEEIDAARRLIVQAMNSGRE